MSRRSRTLRALVTERLTAAAEEIFELVERTIAEYEEELRSSREENQRNQQLLEALGPQQQQQQEPLQLPVPGAARGPTFILPHKQDDAEGREEHFIIKSEPEELSIHLQEFPYTAVRVKNDMEEPSEDATDDWTEPWEPAAEPSEEEEEGEGGDAAQKISDSGATPENDSPGCSGADEGVTMAELMSKARRNRCPICAKTFKRDLWSHMLVHTGERPFSCSVCHKGFTRKSSLSLHMKLHLSERPFRCAVCQKEFTQKSNFTIHVERHAKSEQKLQQRQRRLNRQRMREEESAVREEESAVGEEEPAVGEEASAVREEASAVREGASAVREKASAVREKASAVREKASAVREKASAVREKASAVREKASAVREGASAVREGASAVREEASVREEQRFDLEQGSSTLKNREKRKCREIYEAARSLSLTVKRRDERGDECPVCRKRFHDLWPHMRLHTGERPFRCSVCRKGFPRRSSLSLHKRLHMQEKPFKCPVCQREFTQNNNFKRHMAKHEKDGEVLEPGEISLSGVYLQQFFQMESGQCFEPRAASSSAR